MRIQMQTGSAADELFHHGWDYGIVGVTVDERGKASKEFIVKNSAASELSFLPDTLEVTFESQFMQVEEFEERIAALHDVRLVVDATNLALPELLFCCRAVARRRGSLSLVYTEPLRYTRRRHAQLDFRRDFDLSNEVRPFTALPGAALLMGSRRRTKAVFFVGYEGERLEQALEQTGLPPDDCQVVFGVPAFRPGWEMDSFANNVRFLRQRRLGEGSVLFAGAHNPQSAFRAIQAIQATCGVDDRLLLCPIGTKPHAVGAVLFASERNQVGMIFDHPKKADRRTEQVASWHLYDVDYST